MKKLFLMDSHQRWAWVPTTEDHFEFPSEMMNLIMFSHAASMSDGTFCKNRRHPNKIIIDVNAEKLIPEATIIVDHDSPYYLPIAAHCAETGFFIGDLSRIK